MARTASRTDTPPTANAVTRPSRIGGGRAHARARESAPPAILLVEQDQLLRWALYETLLDAGYRLLPIRDEAHAKELLDHLPEPFAAAVIDEDAWPMTGSGEAWLRERWPGLPILVLAEDPTPSLMRHVRTTGLAEVLSKPFDINELRTSVARLVRLGRRAARHRTRQAATVAA